MSGLFRKSILLAGCLLRAQSGTEHPHPQRVLILNSYHAGLPWTDELNRGLRVGIIAQQGPVDFSTEYLDAKRHGLSRLGALTAQLLEARYKDTPQDLVVLTDDDALEFFLAYGQNLWPGVPAVFCGISSETLLEKAPRDKVTGTLRRIPMESFLPMALSKTPAARAVYVVSDNTTTGVATREDVERQSKHHKNVRFVYLDGTRMTLQEIERGLRAASPKDLVLATLFTADKTQRQLAAHQTQAILANAARCPVASPTTCELGYGYLVGTVNGGFQHGFQAARLAARVLRGEPPGQIPITASYAYSPVVDMKVATRFGIAECNWPAGTNFINREVSLLAGDRGILTGGILLVLLQALIIAALVFNMDKRRNAESRLRRSEAMLERSQQIAGLGSWELDLDSNQLRWSSQVFRTFGAVPGAVQPSLDFVFSRVHPEDRSRLDRFLGNAEAVIPHRSLDHRIIRMDGSLRHVRVKAEYTRKPGKSGEERILHGTVQDVTEFRELEDQVRQAQKMETVGQLAGGVAHDFNNLLTVINGYSQLLLKRSDLLERDRRRLGEILRAGDKAASLTRQLLAFGRRQVFNLETLDLTEVVTSMSEMLLTLVGEPVSLKMRLDPAAKPVDADRAQIEQVILNLVINARNAIQSKGSICVSTMTVHLRIVPPLMAGELSPGDYTILTVSDTGHGMSQAVLSRIFEPFFTTRPTGQGSGLGLSMVYGIIKQSLGYIDVHSQEGKGTEFRVYLPVSTKALASPEAPSEVECEHFGDETILLVEDQEQVRVLVEETLKSTGYRVISAENAEQALSLAHQRPQDIDLIVTDIVMQGMSGPELVARLKEGNPDMMGLMISGYAGDNLNELNFPLLHKPFLPSDLTCMVRAILSQRGPQWREKPALLSSFDTPFQRPLD